MMTTRALKGAYTHLRQTWQTDRDTAVRKELISSTRRRARCLHARLLCSSNNMCCLGLFCLVGEACRQQILSQRPRTACEIFLRHLLNFLRHFEQGLMSSHACEPFHRALGSDDSISEGVCSLESRMGLVWCMHDRKKKSRSTKCESFTPSCASCARTRRRPCPSASTR